MKCPICGEELKSECYRNMPPIGVKTYHSCVYCPNGDFGTDYYAQPSKLYAELQSAWLFLQNKEEEDADSN